MASGSSFFSATMARNRQGALAKEDGVRTAASTTAAVPMASAPVSRRTAAQDMFDSWESDAKVQDAKRTSRTPVEAAPARSVEAAPIRDCPFYSAASSDHGAAFTGY